MEGTRGNLVVSTRSAMAGRKVIVLIAAAVFVFLGGFFLANEELAYEIAWDLFRNLSMGDFIYIGIPLFCFAYAAIALIRVFKLSKSYVEVYENGVVGITEMDRKDSSQPMQHFELKYSDIVNISETNKGIQLFTAYGTFSVTAAKNRKEAAAAIRQRMTGKR